MSRSSVFKISTDSAKCFIDVFVTVFESGLDPVVCGLPNDPYQFIVQCNPSLVTLWSLQHSNFDVHEYRDLKEVWADLALWNQK